MNLQQFVERSNLGKQTEVDRACQLAYFHLRRNGIIEFSASDCSGWLVALGFARPNKSRLESNLSKSGDVVKGSLAEHFRLHHNYLRKLDHLYPQLLQKSQGVIDEGTILPESLYGQTRGYVESLSKQINACYEQNIFDGCAVLMRRLEEILLIHSYEKLGIASAIKDGNGNYYLLEGIVRDAVGNTTLNLSRNSKTTIEDIRKLGNYSAHKVTYTCKREYISEKVSEYRALIDELLHKSGIRN